MACQPNNMRTIALVAIFSALALGADAQTWKEWFQQKKTQKEYLIKQIVALKVYAKYVKEGYDIAQKGLNIVSEIKGQNFTDHQDHFGSLRIVKNDLGNSSRINLILGRQVAIMNEFRELKNICRNNAHLTEEEVRYVDLVYSNLLTECDRVMVALHTLVTDDAYQMSDDERIERIDAIYHDMNDKYAFTRTFCSSTKTLIMQRGVEKREIEAVRKLNGVL
jgi:hypothetical protein